MKHHDPPPGVDAGPELTAELRRLANLFLVSAITLALFLLRMAAAVLSVSFLSTSVMVAWGVLLLAGWAASLVLGVYVTARARRWWWTALCAFPLTCVPASVAYAWVRRGEIEEQVLRPPRRGKAR